MVAAASVMLVSCGDDIGGDTETSTSLDLQAGPDLVTSVTTLAPGATFTVNLVATAGTDELNTLQVFEDGVSIVDFSRITYNDDPAVANPVLLLGDSKTSIDVDIDVVAHTEVGTRTYRFTVVDDAGDAESVSVDVTTVGEPPVLTLVGTVSMDGITAGTLRNINLTAVKGAGSIASIGVTVDGVESGIADLAFDGQSFTSNPHVLEGALVDGFTTKALRFRASMTPGSYEYTVTITDEFGQESSIDFTAIVVPVSTPLDDVLMGVLFSAEGDTGTGGLDLDNGNGTGSSDVEAEIKDQGFAANGSWDQQIGPVNGSKLYLLAENFDFESIDSKEKLAELNGTGQAVSLSGTVMVGQVYIVERDAKVYAFEVVEVNVIANSNDDNYVLNIVK